MNFLDTLSSVFGKTTPEYDHPQTFVATALELVNNQPNGLNGLVQQFQDKGAGEIINSWIGTGENQAISAETLHNVLGSDTIANLAQKAGLPSDQVAGLLSQILPHIINDATPNGTIPVQS